MSKPIFKITLISLDEKKKELSALFDSGSFYTIVRQDCVPSPRTIVYYKHPKEFGTAKKSAKVNVVGETGVVISIGKKMITAQALVSPDLNREMIIGAGEMQRWDISILNKKGKTEVSIGHDMRDPEITEVDFIMPMVKGMQEQQAIIDSLKKEVGSWQSRLSWISASL